MPAAVGVSVDRVRVPISTTRVASIARAVLRAEKVSDAMLSIAFVSNAAIRKLNRRHLGRDGVTDVIAFSLRAAPDRTGPVVGDVYIAPAVARSSARANRVGVREEIARLVVHGTLHVLGYDHPDDEGRTRSQMWRRQERLVQRVLRAS